MDIPTELTGILSEFGLPIWAGAFAYGLVRGADALEEDAKEERLKYISDLLKERSFTSYGKLGASVVPFVFEKVFGSKPLSIKFAFRSVLASLAFWLLLVSIKHPTYGTLIVDLSRSKTWNFLVLLLFIDWLSLVKSKAILAFISSRNKLVWSLSFVLIDILSTLIIFALCLGLYGIVVIAPWEHQELLNSSDLFYVMYRIFLCHICSAPRIFFWPICFVFSGCNCVNHANISLGDLIFHFSTTTQIAISTRIPPSLHALVVQGH